MVVVSVELERQVVLLVCVLKSGSECSLLLI